MRQLAYESAFRRDPNDSISKYFIGSIGHWDLEIIWDLGFGSWDLFCIPDSLLRIKIHGYQNHLFKFVHIIFLVHI